VAVLETLMDFGIPGKLNNELKVPEAVTDTITTQCPAAHVPALGFVTVLQAAEVVVPPLSHPQDVAEVTVRLLTCWPLFWKSLSAAF